MTSAMNAARVNAAAKSANQSESLANQAMMESAVTVEHIPMNAVANVAMEAARKKTHQIKRKAWDDT
jgi:hypothetical protein